MSLPAPVETNISPKLVLKDLAVPLPVNCPVGVLHFRPSPDNNPALRCHIIQCPLDCKLASNELVSVRQLRTAQVK